MKKRTFKLNQLLKPYVHRKDITVLERELLPKHDYVLWVKLDSFQRNLYNLFLCRYGEFEGKKSVLAVFEVSRIFL